MKLLCIRWLRDVGSVLSIVAFVSLEYLPLGERSETRSCPPLWEDHDLRSFLNYRRAFGIDRGCRFQEYIWFDEAFDACEWFDDDLSIQPKGWAWGYIYFDRRQH